MASQPARELLNVFCPALQVQFFFIVQADQLFQPTITNPSNKMYCRIARKAVKLAVSE